jgi:hypothetical protein
MESQTIIIKNLGYHIAGFIRDLEKLETLDESWNLKSGQKVREKSWKIVKI